MHIEYPKTSIKHYFLKFMLIKQTKNKKKKPNNEQQNSIQNLDTIASHVI